MNLNLYKFLIIILTLNACVDSKISDKKNELKAEQIFFDVVEKEIIFDGQFSDNFQIILRNWFDKNIKVDGFGGNMKFIFYDYVEKFSQIPEGKRVDISMKFKIVIQAASTSSKTFINGELNSFGSITGFFNLKDFDNIILDTQLLLLEKLNQELIKKTNSSKN